MYLMARAAKQAGTPAIRTSSIRDVVTIKEETGLPVIGLVKVQYEGFESYITPTMKEVDDLAEAGSDIIALDCTNQKRGDGKTVAGVPACFAARAIRYIMDFSSTYRGSPGTAWQDTIIFPLIF